MSVLVPVSFGELLDKISILEIKQERISDADALVNVRRELEALTGAFDEAAVDHPDLADLRETLRTINETLWDIEDRIRSKEAHETFDEDFIELARAVYQTNDRRSEVKREINRILGSTLVEEKHYTHY